MTTPAIATHEQPGLVALSVAVAIVAGYLALDLAKSTTRAATRPATGTLADVPTSRLQYS